MVLRKILQGGLMLIACSAAYAYDDYERIQIASDCSVAAADGGHIQFGRLQHNDTFEDFMEKVPAYLAASGVRKSRIDEMIPTARYVFQLPMMMSPIDVFKDVYETCIRWQTSEESF